MSKGNRPKSEQAQVEQIIKTSIIINPEQTLDDLSQVVKSALGFAPSRSTVLRILYRLGKTPTRVTRWQSSKQGADK
jgi:hypothetical protein